MKMHCKTPFGARAARRLYIWEWVGGGWNACHACTRAEAIARAKEMGLKIKPGSLHVGTNEEYGERLRSNWARR